MAKEPTETKRRVTIQAAILALLVLGSGFVVGVQSWMRREHVEIGFRPPSQWLDSGQKAGDGLDSVTIIEGFGPVTITQTHRR
jgi:hypothetical protein